MNAQRTYKRKLLNLSVKREMQFRMIGKIFLLLFVSLLLSSLIFYFFADREVTSSFQMFHIKARNFLDFLLPAVLGAFLISLVVGVVGSLFFPKSIAGGVYRIEQELQNVIEKGDLSVQVTLRSGDQVVSLAQKINLVLADYRDRTVRLDRALQQLEQYATDETTEPGRGNLQAAQEAVKQVRYELDQLNY